MLSNAVKELQQRKSQIASQINSLEAEAKKLNTAIKVLTEVSWTRSIVAPGKIAKRKVSAATRAKMRKAQQARWAKETGKGKGTKPAKKQKKISRLGKLRIKLGALNRYGKKAEAKKIQARIAKLEAIAAKKK